MSLEIDDNAKVAFVAERLKIRRSGRSRREDLILQYGYEEGIKRFATETGLLAEVVIYLDTPHSQRVLSREVFSSDLIVRAKQEGVNQVMSRGTVLYGSWLREKHRRQARVSQNLGRRHGSEPHVALRDGSHRNDSTGV